MTGCGPEKAGDSAHTPRDLIPAKKLVKCKDVLPFEYIDGEIIVWPKLIAVGKRIQALLDPGGYPRPANVFPFEHIEGEINPRDWPLDIQMESDPLRTLHNYLQTLSKLNFHLERSKNDWQ
ncbi:hypothetical protein CEK25_004617 [Fusarium fujikuroi]|nr:hypothetical protein CEK25_004617 [Fusarium fujikuroi]